MTRSIPTAGGLVAGIDNHQWRYPRGGAATVLLLGLLPGPAVALIAVALIATDGRTILFGAEAHRRKITNLRRDARVLLSMESPERNEVGMQLYLLIRGRARIEDEGSIDLMDRLQHQYTGADRFFRDLRAEGVPFCQAQVFPEHVGGFGPWAVGRLSAL